MTFSKSKNLSLSFGGLQVLHEVRLDALRGKVTALIGPNGAGKTALLNCVSGIYSPQAGRISFNGEDLHRAFTGADRPARHCA